MARSLTNAPWKGMVMATPMAMRTIMRSVASKSVAMNSNMVDGLALSLRDRKVVIVEKKERDR